MKKMQYLSLKAAIILTGIFASPFALAVPSTSTAITPVPASSIALNSTPSAFSVTLSDPLGTPPTGTVLFTADNGINPAYTCTATLGAINATESLASCSPPVLPPPFAGGTFTVTATYSGDGNYIAGSLNGFPYTFTVTPADIAFAFDPVYPPVDPVMDISGTVVVVFASITGFVAGVPAQDTPRVEFFDKTTSTILCDVDATSTPLACVFATTGLPGTVYDIAVRYAGDNSYNAPANLDIGTYTVSPALVPSDLPVISFNPYPAVVGQPNTVTVEIPAGAVGDVTLSGFCATTAAVALPGPTTVTCTTPAAPNTPLTVDFVASAGSAFSSGNFNISPFASPLDTVSIPTNTTLTLVLMGLLMTALGTMGIKRRQV